ncbi:MAG: hypothetical protein CL961_02445 [Euryarchaeota archaeon]|nr:hypothetical protein [Euryarchaeota archaeon]
MVNYPIAATVFMVEILCPHCEGEIELDDDASGEFACPLCDGEFEWNVEGDESFDDAVTDTDNRIETMDFDEMPAVPKVAGIAFSIYMGILIIGGIYGIIAGLYLSSVESAIGTGTGFGAIFIIISLITIALGTVGMGFGIKTAKGEFIPLIVIACISGLLFLFSIFGYEDAADLPSILIALAFTVGNLCCIFVPILKAQFTGVLVTRSDPNKPKKMVNEFDKTKSIHPLEWAGHGVSLVMLIIVILCLTSSSWYTISAGGDDILTMGLSEVELEQFWGSESATYSDIVEDEEDYYDARCVEGSSAECDQIKQTVDYWKSWKTSTLILKVMLIITLVVSIIGLISRLAAILANTGLMNLPDKGYMVNDMIRKFSPIVVCLLLLIGVVIFMIIQPGLGPDEFWSGGEDVDGSFGAMVWIALVFSMMVPILSKFEIDYS